MSSTMFIWPMMLKKKKIQLTYIVRLLPSPSIPFMFQSHVTPATISKRTLQLNDEPYTIGIVPATSGTRFDDLRRKLAVFKDHKMLI